MFLVFEWRKNSWHAVGYIMGIESFSGLINLIRRLFEEATWNGELVYKPRCFIMNEESTNKHGVRTVGVAKKDA